jgi:D-ribitol-5-phosphate cytidylyltransferase
MNIGVILAGGSGRRFGNTLPKQFVKIKNKSILFHTLDIFNSCKKIHKIIIVLQKNYINKIKKEIEQKNFKKIFQFIEGGFSRQESSYNALKFLKSNKDDIIVIHDAARPFITHNIIEKSIINAKKFGAVDVVVKATDTIIKVKDGFIKEIPNRDNYYLGQTPQSFKFSIIWNAHLQARKEGDLNASDDAKLVLRLGHKVKIIEGSYDNIKLTHRSDLSLINAKFKKKKEY